MMDNKFSGLGKTALIIRGISYKPSYRHAMGVAYEVDYRRCLPNHRANLPLASSDVYLSTNHHRFADALIRDYGAVAQFFEHPQDQLADPYSSIARHIRRCFAQIRASGKNYDHIIISRFDMLFEYPLARLPIDPTKFNFLFYAEDNALMDDNLWVLPAGMMDEFDALLLRILNREVHRTHDLIRYLDPDKANALLPGNYFINTHRPYIKFLREKSPLNGARKLRMKLIHLGLSRRSLAGRREFVSFLKDRLRSPRRELAWRLHALRLKFDKNAGGSPSKPDLHFLTFYTEGHPSDRGLDLKRSYRKLVDAIRPFVDSVTAISARSLRGNPATAIYVQEFDDEAAIYNVATNKIGFLRWKPYIILEKLKAVKDGDIVFYRDCNVHKYPNMLYKIYNIRDTVEQVLKICGTDVFAPIENFPHLKVKVNVKREIFERLGLWSEDNLEHYLHNASIIICRKSPRAMELMEEWLSLCMDDKLLAPTTEGEQHPDFHHNTQEQSILNGLLLLKGQPPLSKPLGISVVHRAFALDVITRVPRVAVLLSGQLRNFDNAELLKQNFKKLLSLYNCDVFLSCWADRGYSLNHGEAIETDYAKNKDATVERIFELFNRHGAHVRGVELADFEAWLSVQKPEIRRLYEEGMPVNDKRVFATAFPQLYKIARANLLKSKYEAENGFKYDLVIRMRPDMCLVEEIPAGYIHELCLLNSADDKIYHMNPPKIFYPRRIYDIFFFGKSAAMDRMAEAWPNIEKLLAYDFDNGLPIVDACRLLYIQALISGLKVVDIPRCIGDIYRDEPMEIYIDKIVHHFN